MAPVNSSLSKKYIDGILEEHYPIVRVLQELSDIPRHRFSIMDSSADSLCTLLNFDTFFQYQQIMLEMCLFRKKGDDIIINNCENNALSWNSMIKHNNLECEINFTREKFSGRKWYISVGDANKSSYQAVRVGEQN